MNARQKKWFSWIALVVILTLAVPWAVFACDVDVPTEDDRPAGRHAGHRQAGGASHDHSR